MGLIDIFMYIIAFIEIQNRKTWEMNKATDIAEEFKNGPSKYKIKYILI